MSYLERDYRIKRERKYQLKHDTVLLLYDLILPGVSLPEYLDPRTYFTGAAAPRGQALKGAFSAEQ